MLTLHYCRQSFGFFTHWNRDLGSSMFYHFFLPPLKLWVLFLSVCYKRIVLFFAAEIYMYMCDDETDFEQFVSTR